MAEVKNKRGSRIVIPADPKGIPGESTKDLPDRKAKRYEREWGDDVDVVYGESMAEERTADETGEDWRDMTARNLSSAIRDGQFDEQLDEIESDDERVTVEDAVEARLNELQ